MALAISSAARGAEAAGNERQAVPQVSAFCVALSRQAQAGHSLLPGCLAEAVACAAEHSSDLSYATDSEQLSIGGLMLSHWMTEASALRGCPVFPYGTALLGATTKQPSMLAWQTSRGL